MKFFPTVTRIALGVLGFMAAAALASFAHRAFVTVPVTVDGEAVAVRRGTDAIDCAAMFSSARPGDLVSASRHAVLEPAGGEPVEVTLNGGAAFRGTPARARDEIRAYSGEDRVEPVAVEMRTVAPPARALGTGPVQTVVVEGTAGLEAVTVGALSGEVIATETVTPCTPTLVRLSGGANPIALTFDDGPWPGQTEAILAVLDRYNVPATFFMLGSRVAARPDLALAVVQAGHVIGNHSYSHTYLNSVGAGRVRWEITATNEQVFKATGTTPRWFRAPGGVLSSEVQAVMKQEGIRSALWTVDPQDWLESMSAQAIAHHVIGNVRPGGVVVMHDGGGNQQATIEALPAIIEGLQARGYTFVTLDELAGVKGAW